MVNEKMALVGWAVRVAETKEVVKLYPCGQLKKANTFKRRNTKKYIGGLQVRSLYMEA